MFLRTIRIQHERIASYSDYPFSIPFVKRTDELKIEAPITFFVGENGSGKSTLLEGIADKCEFNTAGGSRNNVYDLHASESSLGDYLRLSWLPKATNGFFFRAESFFHFASYLDSHPEALNAYGGKSLHHQSHGESFFSLFANRFGQKGIYLLDEPEAALSPQRQLSFLRILHDLTKKGQCQFIIATHSPILLGFPNADIFHFGKASIKKVQYEDTNAYEVTRSFLQHRKTMLEELLRDDEEESQE
ncbi:MULTISPECIES: AAA family ATPase [Shouchella]|uniref:AAA family ATPase n=1 Tax=Shouchella hunanensis TaxID=766894 RepID=A0ABY7W9K9_9BACI|nr:MULTISPECIES: AAA family ATPase [Shouchella]WDF04771.1 AAA family ATPase [Shouchella hunanensis]GAF22010.1 ABC transporter, ATP-binding protein [Bacillus sp. JCM 19047]